MTNIPFSLGSLRTILCAVCLFLPLAVVPAKSETQTGAGVKDDATTKRAKRQGVLDQFKPAAEAWRQSGSKTELTGEADRQRILAEAAVTEKNLDRAMQHYKAALELYPMWPQGQFNLALLCGQTGDYDCGVLHMKEYLLLVPDAADARAAYEKIVIWEDKLENPVAPPKASPVIDANQGCREVTLRGMLSLRRDPVLTLPTSEELKVKLKIKVKLKASNRDADVRVTGTLCGDTIEVRKIDPAERRK